MPLFGGQTNQQGMDSFQQWGRFAKKNMDLKLFEPEIMVSNRVMIKKDMGGDQKFASVENMCSIRKKSG